MLKYRIDKIQWIILITYLIAVIALLLIPYREHLTTGKISYGYKNIFNWAVIIYGFRLMLHSFGVEVFKMNVNLMIILGVEIGGIYVKIFIAKSNVTVMYFNIVMELLLLLVFVLVMYLDNKLYFTGNKADFDI